MSYQIIAIKSMPEFISRIFDFAGYLDEVWYRGVKVHDYHIEPSAYRSAKFRESSEHLEQQSIMAARSYMLHITETHRLTIGLDWLCYLQHNGVPTRLLDWTFEFQVALYFAFEDYMSNKAKPGSMPCVWAFKPRAFMEALTVYMKKNKKDMFGLNAGDRKDFLAKVLSNTRPKDTNFISNLDDKEPRLLVDAYVPFFSPFVSERANVQGGCFIRFPLLDQESGSKFKEHRLENFVANTPGFSNCLAKFVFIYPAAVSKELSIFNLNHSRIYPEVANIGAVIKKQLFD